MPKLDRAESGTFSEGEFPIFSRNASRNSVFRSMAGIIVKQGRGSKTPAAGLNLGIIFALELIRSERILTNIRMGTIILKIFERG